MEHLAKAGNNLLCAEGHGLAFTAVKLGAVEVLTHVNDLYHIAVAEVLALTGFDDLVSDTGLGEGITLVVLEFVHVFLTGLLVGDVLGGLLDSLVHERINLLLEFHHRGLIHRSFGLEAVNQMLHEQSLVNGHTRLRLDSLIELCNLHTELHTGHECLAGISIGCVLHALEYLVQVHCRVHHMNLLVQTSTKEVTKHEAQGVNSLIAAACAIALATHNTGHEQAGCCKC